MQGFGSDDALFDYACRPPEPLTVFVVVLGVADIMGRDLRARLNATSTSFVTKTAKQRLNTSLVIRNKRLR